MNDDMRWVTVLKTTTEAAFNTQWAYLKYPARWKAGERRNLPKMLRDKLSKQGIALIEPAEGARESFIPARVGLPKITDMDALRERYKTEPRLRVVMLEHGHRHGWKDGTYIPNFDALNYPLEWFLHEVRDIPHTLYERLVEVGTNLSADPREIEEALKRGLQPRFDLKVEQWQKERAERTAQALAKFRAQKLAEAVRAEERLAAAKEREKLIERAKNKIKE